MIVWLFLGFIAAVMSIFISEALVIRIGGEKDKSPKAKANAIIGSIILVLMVIAGPLSFAVVIGFIINYMKADALAEQKELQDKLDKANKL